MAFWRLAVWKDGADVRGYRVVCGQAPHEREAARFAIDVFYVNEPFIKARNLVRQLNDDERNFITS